MDKETRKMLEEIVETLPKQINHFASFASPMLASNIYWLQQDDEDGHHKVAFREVPGGHEFGIRAHWPDDLMEMPHWTASEVEGGKIRPAEGYRFVLMEDVLQREIMDMESALDTTQTLLDTL